MADSIQGGAPSQDDLKTQEKALLTSSVSELLAAIHLHLETVNLQLDLRNQVVEICKGQLTSLLQADLLNNIVKINVNENDDYEHQLAYNMVIFDLAKQVAQYFSSPRFQDLLEADRKLQKSTHSSHVSTEFDLRSLHQEAQEMCCKLFEKVYAVFVSHFKTKIYPALARIFVDLPKPLQADDLDFGGDDGDEDADEGADGEDSNEDGESKKHKENSKSFSEQLADWSELHTEELLRGFIPDCVRDFNSDFEAIREKMTLENLVQESDEKAQWVQRDRKVRMIECIDEILHFFLIRVIQMDFSTFSDVQRNEVHQTLSTMYRNLVHSMQDFTPLAKNSRMAQKHQHYLTLIKEEHEIDEESIPFHLRLSLSQPSLKTISVRNLYICERSKLKAELLGQAQLARNATVTYEKTLQDIRKVFAAMAEGRENEAQILIE